MTSHWKFTIKNRISHQSFYLRKNNANFPLPDFFIKKVFLDKKFGTLFEIFKNP